MRRASVSVESWHHLLLGLCEDGVDGSGSEAELRAAAGRAGLSRDGWGGGAAVSSGVKVTLCFVPRRWLKIF